MSVSLNATLKTALDGLDHHPICKIVSTSLASDIPFDGQLFNSQTADETDPDMLVHSTGRLASTFVRSGDLYLMYSDAARTTWYETRIFDNAGISGFSVINASLIELANANIGVVFLARSSSYDRLYSMIIDATGTVVTAASQIVQQTLTSVSLGAMSLCATVSGFLLAYKYINTSASPDDYYIYKRTCNTSFASWSSESSITLTGLISSRDKDHPELFRNQDGAIYLFFDYVDDISGDNERRNIFYVKSTDEGATWTSPEALTSYADFSASAVSPSVSEKDNGDIVLAYSAEINVLKMDRNTSGYCTSDALTEANYIYFMHFVESTGKLYTVSPQRILVIDVSTWSIDKCYKQDGSPGWNSLWLEEVDFIGGADAGENYIALNGTNHNAVLILNTQTEAVRQYSFKDYPVHSVTKNVEGITLGSYDGGQKIILDSANERVYVFFYGTYFGTKYRLGYLDLTETADPITGKYTWNEVIPQTSVVSGITAPTNDTLNLHLNLSEDKFLIGMSAIAGGAGQTIVYTISGWSLYKKYSLATNAGYPRRGIGWPVIVNNVIYGNTPYESNYGQEDRRGLCLVDMTTDAITYERPGYLTVDDYSLQDIKIINDGNELIMGSNYGVIFYSIILKTWTRYSTENVAGLYTDSQEYSPRVAYDESEELVFTSHCLPLYYSDENLVAFAPGSLKYLGRFMSGTLDVDSYIFSSEQNLHLNFGGNSLTISHDDNDVLWNIWSNHNVDSEISLMWDRDNFNPDVSDYILAGSPVTAEWEIGKLAKVGFTLARADLFDTSNSMSIFAPIFKKGRIVELSFGETVSSVDYWQDQGRFVVVGSRVNYQRTEHPVIEIDAEDRSSMWPEMMITATTGYRNASLSYVLDDLLQDIAGLTISEYSVPSLSNAHTLYCQWVDMDLASIVEQICQHFGVFAHWTTAGVWTLKPIDLAAAVSHDYSTAQSKLTNFGPDDRYSSFINRIRVICETNDFLEVLWDEERITQLSGVVGFWTKQETHKVYYSDDRARAVRYPRLDIIQSINDFSPLISLLGGQGDEYIQSEDPDECWCVVKIEAPNRAIYAFAFAAAIAGFGVAALYCEVRFYCGVSIMLTNLALSAFIQVVTAVANFKYDIWGQPIGHEKQTVQATADDTDFQQLIGGQIVTQQFEDPLSYSVQHCQMVADQELDVVMSQRNRISFEKVAHLQDEIGDIIKISHPVSSQALNVFIARLKRIFTRPIVGSSGGRFTDSIEGWRL